MPPQSSAAPQIPPAVLVQQKQATAVMIWAIGAFCILGWEWLVCLPQEYKRIWTKPMNYSSVLYIANRYFGLLQLSIVMTLLANAYNPNVCNHMYLWEPVGALISTILSQMILGSRVYAVFSRSRVVAFVLGSTLIVELVISGIAISTTSPSPPLAFAAPLGIGAPCGSEMGPSASGWLIAFWSIPLLYDTITFLLTAWKAYEYWKVEVDTPLFNIIWRDGLLYFFALFFMNAANVIIFVTAPQSLRPVNITFTIVLEVVLSCRLVLNLRSAADITSGSKPKRPGVLPWSDNSKTRTYNNPSSSIIVGNQTRSESLDIQVQGTTSHTHSPLGRETKLEPNRVHPGSIRNTQALYTN